MMQSALRSRLKADATVAGYVGTRIDWVARPQSGTLPAITMNTVFDARPTYMGGDQVTRQTLVQIDCWGTKYADARNVANAAIACLEPGVIQDGVLFLRSFVDGDRDLSEDTDNGQIFRVSVDMRITHTLP